MSVTLTVNGSVQPTQFKIPRLRKKTRLPIQIMSVDVSMITSGYSTVTKIR